jgi:membrane protein DedA with SNARE-associated domain
MSSEAPVPAPRPEYDRSTVGAILEGLKEWVVGVVGAWGYGGIFFLMIAEAVVFLVPSEVVMPAAGLLVSEGELSLFPAAVVGTLGSVVGAWIFYFVGAAGGRPLLLRYGRWIFIKPADIARAEQWFEQHGNAAVFFSRMVPVVRTLVSLPAGVARMPLLRFTAYTFLGALPWTLALAAVGLALGRNWERILPYFDVATYVVAALVVVVVVWWIYIRARRRARAQD